MALQRNLLPGPRETRGAELIAANATAGSRFTELRPFFFIKVACVALAHSGRGQSLRAATSKHITSQNIYFSLFFSRWNRNNDSECACQTLRVAPA